MLAFPAIGLWTPSQITVSWTAAARKIIPAVDELIEKTWNESLRRPGIHLFNGPMCRLESFDTKNNSLHLALSRTNYKTFLGTNLMNGNLADQYGPEVLANPIGLSAALISSDGFLMLGRRNASVAYYPGRLHPFAGALEPREPLDIFADVRRELREELSLGEKDIEQIVCTGIAEDISLHQPEMIFAVKSTRTREEIELQLDAHEHTGIWTSEIHREAIEPALRSKEAFTPIAIAAILLWGRLEFGDKWFNANRA
jgi:hypothetical protein